MAAGFGKLLIVLAAAMLLAGCGVRGGLEYPAEAKAETGATAQSAQGKPEGAAGKPHNGFILDGLLR